MFLKPKRRLNLATIKDFLDSLIGYFTIQLMQAIFAQEHIDNMQRFRFIVK